MKLNRMAVAASLTAAILILSSQKISAAPSPVERVGAMINVSNLDASVAYFTQLVGLREAARVPIGPGAWEVILSPGGTDVEGQLGLVYQPDLARQVEQGKGFNRLVFFTRTSADVDAIAGKIAAAGFKTVIPPSTAEISGARKYRYAHMKGPDCYTVELTWFDPTVRLSKQ